MRTIKIVIRYYDAKGTVIFEDIPNLGHQYRVPVQWVRWEIYWDETLVQSGSREARSARRTGTASAGRSTGSRVGSDAGDSAAEPSQSDEEPPERDTLSWWAFAR